jgi:hypothetical protein
MRLSVPDRVALANQRDLTAEKTRAIARDPSPVVRRALCKLGPKLPEDVILRLAGDKSVDVRAAIIENHALYSAALPDAAIRRLSLDPNDGVRAALAASPAIPGDVRRGLARDAVTEVRVRAIVCLPRDERHDELLREAANDSETRVRLVVALKNQTPNDLIERLANDAEPEVRRAISLHPDLSAELAEKLAVDPDTLVRSALVSRRDSSESLLLGLALDPFEDVRFSVAMRPPSLQPESVLDALVADSSLDVRRTLADHFDLPARIALSLSDDRSSKIAMRARKRREAFSAHELLEAETINAERGVGKRRRTPRNEKR